MSTVYVCRSVGKDIHNRSGALSKVLAGIEAVSNYREDEILPVKITIGDSPCVYNLSPELVKLVIADIKKKGAKPFLFDTSVIYQGQRQNAVDHMNLAESKGFGAAKVGAPFIVADGVLGQDGREFAIDSPYIKKIKTPSFVGMLDSLVVLSHATGHIVSGYAGAIKNVAMGMACRSTKQVQHSSLKPSVIEKKCVACGCCITICPVKAIAYKSNKAFIDQRICVGCGECLCACKFDAININWHEDPLIFSKRMVDVASVILSKFKNKLYINFAFDITKECDCISSKDDIMISSDIGILASEDIVSLDKATADLSLQHKRAPLLEDTKEIYCGMLEYAEKLGLGSREYQLRAIS